MPRSLQKPGPLPPDDPLFKQGWSVYSPWQRPVSPAGDDKEDSKKPAAPEDSGEDE